MREALAIPVPTPRAQGPLQARREGRAGPGARRSVWGRGVPRWCRRRPLFSAVPVPEIKIPVCKISC